ncbi:hypothetical protein FISHEDRAFT_56812 [Fistulina hepatica ATCC 64428]|uniref:Uncharacterized protein n=1 Tax=Fistulina hepatica ATCC 64428 TaxID=1128425 RepID=A0A0D7AI85_9AGAR|nr:hypothetical protein FISHEDRAFT_56812 [Fistulina hepatica ATCC 64428]
MCVLYTNTLDFLSFSFKHPGPTTRAPPPPRQTTIEYQQPTADPPSTSLTALLCIRILFRTSFASAEVAPRVDGHHFGFPGIVEDDEADTPVEADDLELQGEMKGRRVFYAVRHLMQGVRIRDEVLMSWIDEMVDI